jgi:hypothetical protein
MGTDRIPTDAELAAADNYALSMLCTEIPERYGNGLTVWDPNTKSCKITSHGCTPGVSNPLSQKTYTDAGVPFDYNQYHPTFKNFWKYSQPEFLVMKKTASSPDRAVCSRGSEQLYSWCTFPQNRDKKHKAGVTDAQPFQYGIIAGKETCIIPKSYCDAKGVSYNEQAKECYVKTGQKIAEFISSASTVRSGRTRNVSDRTLKKNIKLARKDYIRPGIHLYTFDWTEQAWYMYGNSGAGDVGFIADELPAEWIYHDNQGFKHINLDYDDNDVRKIKVFLDMKKKLYEIYYNKNAN